MAVSDARRLKLYEQARAHWGEETAEVLMEVVVHDAPCELISLSGTSQHTFEVHTDHAARPGSPSSRAARSV